MKTTEEILAERGNQYGSYEGKAAFIQAVKERMRNAPSWETLTPAMQETLDMVIHKISRILWGDPLHRDSWQDIIGYTELVVKSLPASHVEYPIPGALVLLDPEDKIEWAAGLGGQVYFTTPKFPVYTDKED